MIKIGNKAPAFSLVNQDDQKTSLSDFAGQWLVLYFYPKDDTPGCTTEACEFTASLKDFESLNAHVVGISPDSTQSHVEFIKKFKLKISLLSDPQHTMMEKYQAWGEKNMYGKISVGVIRSTVLIDPNGKIAHHWKRVKTAGHAQKVNEKIAELQKDE